LIEIELKRNGNLTGRCEIEFFRKAVDVAAVMNEPVAAMVDGTQIVVQPTHEQQCYELWVQAVSEREGNESG